MKRILFLLIGMASLWMGGGIKAQNAPNVENLLEGVRQTAILQTGDLTGKISSGAKSYPMSVFLRGKDIQYQVHTGGSGLTYQLTLGDARQQLRTMEAGERFVELPVKRYVETIGETDLTYEDLALRFLYWKNGKIEGQDNIQSQDCYRVLLQNPDQRGAYGSVKVWIGSKTAALMQIEAFDRQGVRVKRFSIVDVMKMDGGQYFVQTMKVEPYILEGRRAGRPTYIEFNKPKKVMKRPE